jgi:hypothetical protein
MRRGSRSWQGEGSNPRVPDRIGLGWCFSVRSISSPGSRGRVATLSVSLEVFTLTPQVVVESGSPWRANSPTNRGAERLSSGDLPSMGPRKRGARRRGAHESVVRSSPAEPGASRYPASARYRFVDCMFRVTASRSSLSGRGARCARRRRVSTHSSSSGTPKWVRQLPYKNLG